MNSISIIISFMYSLESRSFALCVLPILQNRSPLSTFIWGVHIDGWAEEERISAHGWRTTYLGMRMKNDISRCENEKRRISAQKSLTTYLGALMATTRLVLHPRTEIRRSSSARRDTFFFRSAVDMCNSQKSSDKTRNHDFKIFFRAHLPDLVFIVVCSIVVKQGRSSRLLFLEQLLTF